MGFLNRLNRVVSVVGALGLFSSMVLTPTSHAQINEHQPVLLVSSDNSSTILAYNGATGQSYGVFAAGLLDRPRGFVYGSDGDLYVASSGSSSIIRFDGRNGILRGTFVPSGSGNLSAPQQVAFGPDGHLLVTDSTGRRVRKYNGTNGAFIEVLVSSITQPNFFIVHDDGFLYILSSGSGDSVRRYNALTGAFDRNFVSSRSGGLDDPQDLTFGPDGHLYVSSGLTNQVLRYDGTTGAFIDVFVSAGSGGLNYPKGIEFGPDGHLYVADYFGDSVNRYNGQTGDFIDSFVPSGSAGLNGPVEIKFVLFNDPPSQPMVEVFQKQNPDLSFDFYALASESADPEGDPVRFSYDWLSEGLAIELQPGVEVSGPVVRNFVGSPGQSVECIVTPSDGFKDGPSGMGSTTLGAPELFPDGVMNAKDLLILLRNWHKQIESN